MIDLSDLEENVSLVIGDLLSHEEQNHRKGSRTTTHPVCLRACRDYDPTGAVEESSSSSDDSDGEQDREHRAEGHAKAVRGAAARMLAAGDLTGHPLLRLYTRSCRLEMYVSQELWDSLDGCAAALSPVHILPSKDHLDTECYLL